MDPQTGMQTVEWYHLQMRPWIATSSDGRVKIWNEMGACLVLPSPAAEILERIEARRACSRDAD
jgi:hypothetical protein